MFKRYSVGFGFFESAGRWGLTAVSSLLAMLFWISGAIAAEVVLVHDISSPHPRLKYFDELVADVARRTGDVLKVTINPGGKILYNGKASLDAVLTKKAPVALINSAHLESINPRIGLINQPFAISDEIMLKPTVAEGMIKLMQSYVEPKGLQIMGLMRGADTLFILKKHKVRKPEDLKGLKIRVAGSGVFQDMVNSFGAEPLVIPFTEITAAMEKGTVQGVLTSPGGWVTQFGLSAPHGTLVPGLIFMTYSLVADKAWLEGLPTEQRQALLAAARTCVTEKWQNMQRDDEEIISKFVAQGADYWAVPPDQLQPWKKRVEGMKNKFSKDYPDVMQQYHAILQSVGR